VVNTDFPHNFKSLMEPYSGRAPGIMDPAASPDLYTVKTTTNPFSLPIFFHISLSAKKKHYERNT